MGYLAKRKAKPIGSDFVVERNCPRKRRCSECRKDILAFAPALVSVYKNRVRKRVCGEECRLEFDARYWQGQVVGRMMKEMVGRVATNIHTTTASVLKKKE